MAGDLASDERSAMEMHLGSCPVCTDRHRQRRLDQHSFPVSNSGPSASSDTATATVTAPRAAVIPRAPAPPPRWEVRPGWAALSLLAAAGIAVVFLLFPGQQSGDGSGSAGAEPPLLRMLVVHEGGLRQVATGEEVHSDGDFRFAVDPGRLGDRTLGLVGRNAGGKARVYFPEGAGAARPDARTSPPALDAQGFLPGTVRLDPTLGREALHALFCERVVNLAALRSALEAGDGVSGDKGSIPGDPQGDCVLETLVIYKRGP